MALQLSDCSDVVVSGPSLVTGSWVVTGVGVTGFWVVIGCWVVAGPPVVPSPSLPPHISTPLSNKLLTLGVGPAVVRNMSEPSYEDLM